MQQNESPLIRALTEYYDGKNILSTRFDCAHRTDCQRGRASAPNVGNAATYEEFERIKEQTAGKFVEAKSASVGEFYENPQALGIPRLLFVSADPGSSVYLPRKKGGSVGLNWVPRENRTPESVRRIRCVEGTPYGSAGRGQDSIARIVFAEFSASVPPAAPVARYIAHVNAAKCCQNKKKNEGDKHNNALADDALFKNCEGYLRGEIEVLCPDVIVSQGKEAMESVGKAFSVPAKFGCERVLELRGGKSALWIPTCHPNSRSHFHNQRNSAEWGPNWDGLAKRIRDFISDRDS